MKDIKEITDQLERGVKEVFNSDRYKNYLDTMSKFYQYSANNVMLILMQKPDASLIASYKSWQKVFKRNVKKGEHAIRILAPITHKYTKEVTLQDGTKEECEGSWLSYMGVPVFDISQTEGEALPEICKSLSGDVAQFDELIENLVAISPVPVEYEDIQGSAFGYFSHTENRIVLRQKMEQRQTIKTLVHEIAHAILHNDSGEESEADRKTKEVQAESVAYTVCKAIGIDTEDYSFGYIVGWSKGKEVNELTASMEIIRKTAFLCVDNVREMYYNVCGVVILASVFNFRLPDDLREYIEKQAIKNRTSMGHYIVTLIDKDMKEKESKHGNRKAETVRD